MAQLRKWVPSARRAGISSSPAINTFSETMGTLEALCVCDATRHVANVLEAGILPEEMKTSLNSKGNVTLSRGSE